MVLLLLLLLLLLVLPSPVVRSLGEDVCREVSEVASQLIIAARSWKNPEWGRDVRSFGPKFPCLAESVSCRC
jgi:hypothetical protein